MREPPVDVRDLPIDSVYPNPDQPRKLFEVKALEELASSIHQHGLLQPIKVRPDGGGRFIIVLGERRWRAHKLLGRETIVATVSEMSDDDLADQAIIDNMVRKDITPLEEAKAFQARLDTGLTVEQLAKRLGLKQPWRITERTSLLRLASEFQEALSKDILTPAQAFEMSRLSTLNQRRLFEAIRKGKCKTYQELRAMSAALLNAEKQVGMFPDDKPPSAEERDTLTKMEKRIESLVSALREGFDGNDAVILRKVNPLKAAVIGEQLELIEQSVRRMRLALKAAEVSAPARSRAI